MDVSLSVYCTEHSPAHTDPALPSFGGWLRLPTGNPLVPTATACAVPSLRALSTERSGVSLESAVSPVPPSLW